MNKLEYNCATGETIITPLTPSEIADAEARAAEAEARFEAEEAARVAFAAARTSARAKLAALGLNEAEIAALVK